MFKSAYLLRMITTDAIFAIIVFIVIFAFLKKRK